MDEFERIHVAGMVAELSVTLMGVENSLDLLANLASPLGTPETDPIISFFSQLPALKEPPSRLRCALYFPNDDVPHSNNAWTDKFREKLSSSGWSVRQLVTPPSVNALILDGHTVVIGNPAFMQTGATPVFRSGTEMASIVTRHFETIWQTAVSSPTPSELLYEDGLRPSLPEVNRAILVRAQEVWEPVLRQLNSNPQELFGLPARRFEELIAELLAREGFETYLTPASRDGGCDVLAIHNSPIGKELYRVECKRYAIDRPVGVALVRSLYGVVEQYRSTVGLLVTRACSHY